MKKHATLTAKSYLVGIPVPRCERNLFFWKAEMKKPKVTFIEIVPDADLKKKEREVTETMRHFYPHCGPVRLYRTEDGRVGFQAHLSVTSGDRKRLDQAYR